MARRRPASSRGATSGARKTRSKSPAKKPAAAAAVEVVEEAEGPGIEAGVLVITTVVLLAACLCVDALLGTYGQGLFFK